MLHSGSSPLHCLPQKVLPWKLSLLTWASQSPLGGGEEGEGRGGSGLPARLCHGALRSCLPDGADTETFPALASRFGQLVLSPWVGVGWGAFFSDPSRAPAQLFPPQEPPFTHNEVSHEPIQASFSPRCWAWGGSSGLGRGGRISLPK